MIRRTEVTEGTAALEHRPRRKSPAELAAGMSPGDLFELGLRGIKVRSAKPYKEPSGPELMALMLRDIKVKKPPMVLPSDIARRRPAELVDLARGETFDSEIDAAETLGVSLLEVRRQVRTGRLLPKAKAEKVMKAMKAEAVSYSGRLIDLERRCTYDDEAGAMKARSWTRRQVRIAVRIGMLLPVCLPAVSVAWLQRQERKERKRGSRVAEHFRLLAEGDEHGAMRALRGRPAQKKRAR